MDELYEREWPVQGAKAGVAIVHGLAEHSGRYDYVAQKLNAAGYSAAAVDVRGHGRSPGFPGDMGSDVQALVDDVVRFCERVRAGNPKTFLLAHSMGTILSLPAVTETPEGTLAGLILSGVAIMPGPAVLESLAQGKGIPPDAVSRDREIVKAYTEDPLVFYDRVPGDVWNTAAEATARAVAAVPLITIPTLLIHGGADSLCDVAGAYKVYAELVGGDKTVKVYDGLYHEVLNEPERDDVIADVVAWLDRH